MLPILRAQEGGVLMLKLCSNPMCSNRVPVGVRRCPACKRARHQAQDRARPSAARRGYGAEWRRIRAAYLRECPLCQRCGAVGQEVHHRDGDSSNNEPGNLETLCQSCHSGHTMRHQVARGAA